MIVRSFHFGFDVPEADSAQASVYYPGDEGRLDEARLTGRVPPDPTNAPWPLVVVLPGINIAPDCYRWLAHHLVGSGNAVAIYTTIGSLGPAGQGISPGIDMAALGPDTIGRAPSATALGPLLTQLSSLDEPAPLIDLARIGLFGHSAGGTVALHNSRPDWVEGLCGVATFGAHTMSATALGHGEATITPIPAEVPVMLIGAATDSVIEESRDRYGSGDGDHDPIGLTFEEAIDHRRGDSWFVEFAQGNHFTPCDPVDETSGRSFLERDLRADDKPTRDLLANVVSRFFDTCFGDAPPEEPTATLSATLSDNPGISRWSRR